MSKQHRRTWQRHEQAVAAALGTERTAAGAQNRRDGGADVRTDWLVAECKSWSRLPARVVAALEQAERSADSEQLPIAVLHQVGQRREDNLCVMRWGDFLDWFGPGVSEK
ncbi:MAG: hypothetical protein M5U29_04240 [Anaerolineae bacterium]|nr:hypothetical protein [Anaerolineae bacterium]